MIRARVCEDGWVRCGNCRHKLMKVVGATKSSSDCSVEIKCHSCKEINTVIFDTPKSPKKSI